MATTQIKDGFNGGSDYQLKVNSDGSINTTGSGGNASVGASGAPAPGSGTQIAGVDPSGNLTPVSVDSNGFVNVQGVSTIIGPVEQAGLNSYKTTQWTIGTSEIEITPTPLVNRSSIGLKVITNSGTILFSQSVGTAATDGFPMVSGDNVQMDLTDAGKIYAIATAPNQKLYVIEMA